MNAKPFKNIENIKQFCGRKLNIKKACEKY